MNSCVSCYNLADFTKDNNNNKGNEMLGAGRKKKTEVASLVLCSLEFHTLVSCLDLFGMGGEFLHMEIVMLLPLFIFLIMTFIKIFYLPVFSLLSVIFSHEDET